MVQKEQQAQAWRRLRVKTWLALLAIAVLALTSAACGDDEVTPGSTPTPEVTPSSTPTPEVTPTSTPTPEVTPSSTPTPTSTRQAVVLYSDDFSSDASGWDTFEDEERWVSYEEGWLHITNYNSAGISTWSNAHQNFTDLILEVETKLVAGSDDNWHSVLVRDLGLDDYYSLGISADGYYASHAMVNGSRLDLVEPTRSRYINQGRDVTNLVRVEAVGSTLRLSVNGHFLVEITDTNLRNGDIGLATSSVGGEFSEIAFDNIVVTAP
jgi:hypothetical protein